MNQDWNTSVGGLLRRIIWLTLWVGVTIAFLRLMAWADTGSRKLDSNEVAPSERAKDINYGPN